MSMLRFRDADGTIKEVPYLKGEKGEPGEVTFAEGDKEELVNMVLAALPNGDEVLY